MKQPIWRAQVRLPIGIVHWLKDKAEKEYKSMNRLIIEILEKAKQHDTGN